MTEHLVIPFAACAGPAWASAMKTLPPNSLQHLGKLLQGMQLVQTHTGDAHSLSPPHERVLAAAMGLPDATQAPDGLIPWAALAAHQAGMPPGKAWAFVTPCHWAMGREHATLTDPAGLAVTADEAHTLHAAMQPYFGTEGITLHPTTPGRWLAEGEVFRTLPTASLDRVLGRNVDAWLPGNTAAKQFSDGRASEGKLAPSGGSALREAKSVGAVIRRLQNEMQMLLYTHPLNDARSNNRQRTVNSFWLSGSGALPERDTATVSVAEAPTTPRKLAQAVFNDDWAAYAAAWAALDAGDIAQLLARQKAGQTVRLTLCGDRHAQTFESAKTSLFNQIKNLFSPMPLYSLLEQL